MTEYSPRLNLPFIQQAQAQKHVTHNVAIERLDLLVQLVVEAFDAVTPPDLPQEGQIWALAPAPTGAWAGMENALAAWVGGGWLFIPPTEGWLAVSGGVIRLWSGSAWISPAPAEMQNVSGIGVNTSFDTANRLSVSSPATLLTHEGADHQLKINKADASDTASVLFQTDWSGRAEMGTAGNDDFSVKVSPDGAIWNTGLLLDRSTGNAVMKQVQAEALTGNAVTQSDTDTTAGRVMRTGHRVFPALISADSDTGSVDNGHWRAVLSSEECRAQGTRSLVAASHRGFAEGENCAIVASRDAHVSGDRNAVFGSSDAAIVNANRCFIGGCTRSNMNGASTSALLASADSGVVTSTAAVVGSRRTINNVARSLAMGDSGSGDPLTANRRIHLFSETGNIQIAGSLTSSHTFSDFAEMFPNATGAEIPLGTIVTEESGAVRPAGPGDDVAGVVTATAVVTAGDTPFAWQGRYLSDEWGQPIMEQMPDPDHEGEGPAPLVWVQKENPEWNPAAPQIPRSQRPLDWTRVGLLGQVFTRVAEDVMPGDRLSGASGIGVRSTDRTGLRCMYITQPYDAAKGYAVARCLINVKV